VGRINWIKCQFEEKICRFYYYVYKYMNDMLFNNRNKIKDKMLAYGMIHAILFRKNFCWKCLRSQSWFIGIILILIVPLLTLLLFIRKREIFLFILIMSMRFISSDTTCIRDALGRDTINLCVYFYLSFCNVSIVK